MYSAVPEFSRLILVGRIVCLGALAALGGCSTFSDWPFSQRGGIETPARTDRFVLPADGSDVVGEIQTTVAREQDTLHAIARRYDLGYEEIVSANPGVDPWIPGEGTRVVLPTQFVLPGEVREGLVLNLAAMRLYYYPPPDQDGQGKARVVVTHPIGIGKEGWQTPEGETHIIDKVVRPTWTVPASVLEEYAKRGEPLEPIVPPGPDNPLGSHAMRLSLTSYLIHGTNKPFGVGMRVSHGCVRLYPEDIARLFPEVPVGTRVLIINEPYAVGWRDGRLYLDAHRPLADQGGGGGKRLAALEKALARKAAGTSVAVDWKRAQRIAANGRGIPVPVTAGSPDLDSVLAAARRVPSEPYWAALDYADL